MNYKKISVGQPWFDLLKEGKKIVEGRVNKGIFKNLQKGDIVEWFNKKNNKKFKSRIVEINKYNSFKEMLNTEKLENVLPHPSVKTIQDGVNVYRQFYSEEIESQLGVLAIKIELTGEHDEEYYKKKYLKYKKKYLDIKKKYLDIKNN